MGYAYGRTMFTEAVERLQAEHGSREQYRRMAERRPEGDALGPEEIEFIAGLDSFYIASVNAAGWPYMQHRGGPKGFLRVLDPRTLAFADFAGNKQYITTGNLQTDDRVSLFLMDYPHQARLKLLGHAREVPAGADPELDRRVAVEGYAAKIERVVVITLVAFDWNCSQHITPRWSRDEMLASMSVPATS